MGIEVSVIIPTYNASKYISYTLKSVLTQTFNNYEVVIVDDGSTDNTVEIISEFLKVDNRLKLYEINNTGLPSKVRNYGFSKAKGKYIAFLDSDDIWLPKKLEQQLNILNNSKLFGMVYSVAYKIGETSFFKDQYGLIPISFRAHSRFDELIKRNTICCSSVVIKTNIFEEMGGFDESSDLKAVEDYDLWLRISQKYSIKFINKLHVYYRVHDKGISSDKSIINKRNKFLFEKRNIPYELNENIVNKKGYVVLIKNIIHFINTIYVYINYKIN